MTTSPVACVVDASVAIKLFLTETLSDEAYHSSLTWRIHKLPFMSPIFSTLSPRTSCGSTSSEATFRNWMPIRICSGWLHCQ